MSSPLGELKAMASIKDRIDAVAKDLKSRVKKYDTIDSDDLLRALGEDPDDEYNDPTHYLHKEIFGEDGQSAADWIDELVPFLSKARAAEIKAWRDLYKKDAVEHDSLKLTKEEKEILQVLYDISRCKEGDSDYNVCFWEMSATDGTSLVFQGFVGDSGDLEISSPYESEGFGSKDDLNVDEYRSGEPLKKLLAEQKKRKATKAKRAKTSKNKKK